jgi:hypothetical protein
MRGLWLIVSALAILFGILFYLAYQVGGLKYYLQARREIAQLAPEPREKALRTFVGTGGEREYRGIVGYVNTYGRGGVLVWGSAGPKYFASDYDSIYSFFNACSQEILSAKPEQGAMEVYRSVGTDIKQWSEQVKIGDFVAVSRTPEAVAQEQAILREAWVHDWWYFLPHELGVLCER